MKGMVLGVVGVGGIGAAAVMGGGGGPDDFIAVVNKPPAAVYAAFSDLGREGEVSVPTKDGWGARVKQRVVKVPNEQVKLELLIDEESLLSAEVQFAPEGQGTRVAAELDFNEQLLRRIVKETGGPSIPTFVFQDFLIDQVFAMAMEEMMVRIDEGRPLMSLAETHSRWGSGDNGGGTFRHTSRSMRSGSGAAHGQTVRPQMDARPTLDPDAAVRQQAWNNRPDGQGR